VKFRIDIDRQRVEEIQRMLVNLDNRTGNSIIRKISKKHLQPLADYLRATFPRSKNPGEGGHTADQIKVRPGNRRKNAVSLAVATKNSLHVQNFLEFGTKNKDGTWRIPPQFNFIKGHNKLGQKAADNIILETLQEIDKVIRA